MSDAYTLQCCSMHRSQAKRCWHRMNRRQTPWDRLFDQPEALADLLKDRGIPVSLVR